MARWQGNCQPATALGGTTQRGWLTDISLAQKGDTIVGNEPAGRIKTTTDKMTDKIDKIDDIP
jgi:hypothetical protein